MGLYFNLEKQMKNIPPKKYPFPNLIPNSLGNFLLDLFES